MRLTIGSPGGLTSRLPHHLTCGSASGGSGQINGFGIELGVHFSLMHIVPVLPQIWHSPFRQPAIIQRSLDNARSGHKPVTTVAARGFVHLCPVDAQPDELSPPRARSLPLFPVVHAHTSPHPLVQLRDDTIGLAETKVVHPAYHVSP